MGLSSVQKACVSYVQTSASPAVKPAVQEIRKLPGSNWNPRRWGRGHTFDCRALAIAARAFATSGTPGVAALAFTATTSALVAKFNDETRGSSENALGQWARDDAQRGQDFLDGKISAVRGKAFGSEDATDAFFSAALMYTQLNYFALAAGCFVQAIEATLLAGETFFVQANANAAVGTAPKRGVAVAYYRNAIDAWETAVDVYLLARTELAGAPRDMLDDMRGKVTAAHNRLVANLLYDESRAFTGYTIDDAVARSIHVQAKLLKAKM